MDLQHRALVHTACYAASHVSIPQHLKMLLKCSRALVDLFYSCVCSHSCFCVTDTPMSVKTWTCALHPAFFTPSSFVRKIPNVAAQVPPQAHRPHVASLAVIAPLSPHPTLNACFLSFFCFNIAIMPIIKCLFVCPKACAQMYKHHCAKSAFVLT